MKINKNKSIGIILCIFCLIITCFLQVITETVQAAEIDGKTTKVIINVAIENSGDLWMQGLSVAKEKWDHNINYSWIVDNTEYIIQTHETNLTMLENYTKLNQSHVLIESGIQDEHFWCGGKLCWLAGELLLGIYSLNKTGEVEFYWVHPEKIRENLEKFIREGKKGYIGHCSSSEFPIGLDHDANSVAEQIVDNNRFFQPDKCNVSASTYIGFPFSAEHFSKEAILNLIKHPRGMPTVIGQMAYLWYSGKNGSNETHKFGGMPLDMIVRDTNHPILNGYFNDTITMRYSAGPALTVTPPDNKNVTRLMDYPDNVGEDQWSKIIAWRWPLIKSYKIKKYFAAVEDMDVTELSKYFLPGDHFGDKHRIIRLQDFSQKLLFPPQDTEIQYIEPHLDNKHAILAFNYPEGDDNGGRVFLCTVHPESQIWNRTGNYLTDMNDTQTNSLMKGLHCWKNDNGTPGLDPINSSDDRFLNLTDKNPVCVNAWFCQREVAWASNKVPDSDMPPVYGPSQVVDITPLIQENPEFTIKCCVLKRNGETWNTQNLTLWYQYNGENSSYTWTNWTYYDSINTTPYRFTFNANNANGSGIYRFCSTLNTTNTTGYTYNEPLPNATYQGPDAWCAVGGTIIASFRYNPATPYVGEKTYFYSEAVTKNNTHITNYNWNWGDGSSPTSGPNVQNVTHTYTNTGNYTLNFTVTNNLSQKSSAYLIITVLNNPPEANFTVTPIIAQVNDTIAFTDTSYDCDGSIVNYTWDLGDGTISYLQNTSHCYNSSNFYTITLQVRDNDNGSDLLRKTNCILMVDSIVNGSLPEDLPMEKKWNTIQQAINHSATKDMISISNGTYHENITINKSMSLIGCDKDHVILNGSIVMTNPLDYELPIPYTDGTELVNGTELIMHFNNDKESGEDYLTSNLILDYSGQHHNGTRSGATWNTSTLKGAGCFSFDGRDDSIHLDSIPALAGVNVTVSAWVYWTGGSENLDPVLSQVNSSGYGYHLGVNTTSQKPFFQLDETPVASTEMLSSGWHHIVGKHNETTLSIYVDGVFKGSINKTGCGVATPCFIGYDNATEYFDGRIDEVAIWNRTLSGDEEISAMYPVSEISVLYRENYGVYVEGFTICNAGSIGVQPCNHSDVVDCEVHDNPIGVVFHKVNDARIARCNITGGSIGISINGSSPTDYDRIRLVDCVIDNVTNAIMVNDSANITFIRNLVNGSQTNLTFQESNFSSMYITLTTSVNNVAPDTPSNSGPTVGDPGISYTYTTCTNDSNDDIIQYLFDWDDENDSGWLAPYQSNESVQASHMWAAEGGYYVRVKAKDVFNNESSWSESILFRTETLPPIISTVQHAPDITGFGDSINIQANVTDDTSGNYSGVKIVSVNITFPDQTTENYTMEAIGNDTYLYNFSDTWLVGQYNYTIWAMDNAYNLNNSTGHHFHVSAEATMSIATLKDSYTGNQFINITDPPNPLENYTLVDRGLTWDKYYNATTGQNILEVSAGPINYQEDGSWIPINNTLSQLAENHPAYVYGYRSGNNRGLYGGYFKSNAQHEWPVAFTYNKSDDPTIHAVRSKLVGVGYVDPASDWAYEYLQNVQSSQGQTNDNSITYPGVFTGTDVTWSYGNVGLKEEITLSNTTKTVLQNHPPSQYGLNDTSSYLVFITRLDYQNLNLYNNSGLLNGNVTISDVGVDFKDVLGQFKCALPLGEAYEMNNESNRERLTYRIIHLNGDTYLLSGLKISELNAMMFPVVIDPTLTVYSTSSDGFIATSGTSYSTIWAASTGTVYDTLDFINIGQYKFKTTSYIYRGFAFFNTSALPSNAYLDNATLSLYKRTDYSDTDFDITIQNGQPTYPHDPLQSSDYNKSQYSGNGGTLNTAGFTSGYNPITLTNLTWVNTTGITKLCLRSSRDISGTAPTGYEFVSIYSREFIFSYPPKLVIYYRNQSKIKNTESTDIKGYLLIQIQFYNTSQSKWVLDNDTINETTPRTITSGNQLALDTIFNGLVRASDLTYGTGTYRVYTAFRDPEGNILRTNDDVDLEAWWQFNKT